MTYSIASFITHLEQTEKLLENDFKGISESLYKEGDVQISKETKLKLVEQLQFHDIIRQKIEHVRHFMENALKDQTSVADFGAFDFSPELMGLSLALMEYTFMEYKEVIERTEKLFKASGNEAVKDIFTSNFRSEVNELIKNLKTQYLRADAPDTNFVKGNLTKYKALWDSFSMQSEREVFSMLFEGDATEFDNSGENPEGQIELF